MGLGPLEPLLGDTTISDILVNGPHQVYVERRGKLELTDVRFNDDKHLMNIIDRIVSAVGRRIDESSPMVDARLKDGSRVNAIIPPLAIDGPSMSIRRFAVELLSIAGPDRSSAPCQNRRRSVLRGDRQGAPQRARLRRHGLRQDDDAEHPVGLHSARRAHRHRSKTRRNCSFSSRTWCGWKRAREHRRPRRSDRARPGQQQPADAPRPHHRRRSARRGSARHAAGDEHRPRWIADHRSREHAARCAEPDRDDGVDDRHRSFRLKVAARRRSPPPSTSSFRWSGRRTVAGASSACRRSTAWKARSSRCPRSSRSNGAGIDAGRQRDSAN